jgi:cytochrome c-type biogenesis protein CcmH/NrfG
VGGVIIALSGLFWYTTAGTYTARELEIIGLITGTVIFVMGLLIGWPTGSSRTPSEEKKGNDIEKLRKAVSIRPDKAEFWNALSCRLIAMEYFDEAITDAKKAVELEPNSAPFWTTLGEAYQAAGNAEGATKAFQKSIAIDPNQGNLINKLREPGTNNNA